MINMVVRVEGYVDGQKVVFQKGDGGVWEATVPLNLTGIYIVTIYAYDEAGNLAEVNKALFIADPKNMRYEILPLNFGYRAIEHHFSYKIKEHALYFSYVIRNRLSSFWYEIKQHPFVYEVVSENMLFYLGETKEVKIAVFNRKNEIFTIQRATYEIRNSKTGEVVESGNAIIDGHEISVFFTPSEKGKYHIIYTYEVVGERLKALVNVEVM